MIKELEKKSTAISEIATELEKKGTKISKINTELENKYKINENNKIENLTEEDIINLCKKARLQSNIKIIDVAKGTDLPKSNVTMFEHGKTRSGKLLMWYMLNTDLCKMITEMLQKENQT